MNLLFVANSSLASPTGGGRTRVIDAAKQARNHNHKIRILCFVRPEQLIQLSFLRSGKASLEAESGCHVSYFPRLPFTRFVWMTYLNRICCGLVIGLCARIHGIQVIHSHGLMAAWYALLSRRVCKYKVLADAHGLLYQEAIYADSLNREGGLANLYQEIESDILEKADRVVFVSHAMRSYYENIGVRVAHSAVIPCAVNGRQSLRTSSRLDLRRKLGIEDKLVFIYVGSAAAYQQVAKMCELFATVQKRCSNAFFFILTHQGEEFTRNLQATSISPNEYYIASVQHDNVFEYLQAGDIGLLLRDASPVNQVSSPTKFGEYCICGVPVITTNSVGDVSKLVLSNRLGYVIDLESFAEDKQFDAFLLDVQEKRTDYFLRCTEFVSKGYSWQHFGNVLSDVYDALETY